MDRVVFTKYSNRRNEEYSIITKIMETESGDRFVYKQAENIAATAFVNSFYDKYLAMRDYFKDSRLQIVPCERVGEKIKYKYIEGNTLEEILTAHMRNGDRESLFQELELYRTILTENIELVPFSVSEEFKLIFGNTFPEEELPAYKISNIDMVFGNVMKNGTEMTAIDCEFVYSFPIPVEYLLYRACAVFFVWPRENQWFDKKAMMSYFGISEERQKQYAAMDEAFYQHIMGSNTNPARNISKLKKDELSLDTLLLKYKQVQESIKAYDIIINSTSWKITKPIRKFMDVLRNTK